MREEYKKELKDLEEKMIKAEEFAKKVPLFSEIILFEKLTGEEDFYEYADCYKNVLTFSGISRAHFCSGTRRTVSNFNKRHDVFLWKIYINTLYEYNSQKEYGLNKIKNQTPVYFYDALNNKFYATDDQIEQLLEKLNEWKINAVKQHEIDSHANRLTEAMEKAKKAAEEVEKLKRGLQNE